MDSVMERQNHMANVIASQGENLSAQVKHIYILVSSYDWFINLIRKMEKYTINNIPILNIMRDLELKRKQSHLDNS